MRAIRVLAAGTKASVVKNTICQRPACTDSAISAVMRTLLKLHREWLSVAVKMPSSPGPEPGRGRLGQHEGRRGNLGSFSTVRQLAAVVKNQLKRSQYRPDLMDGCLAQAGLSLETGPPYPRPRPAL